jgi:hypothetical protein
METYQLTIGAVGFGLYWLLIRFITNHKNVLAKPEAEQHKLKKQLYWSMALVLLVYFGAQLLINSKTTGWVPWLIFGSYIFVWAMGGYFVWRAYRIGIKNDLAKVTKLNGQLFNNPQKFVRSVTVTNLLTGFSIWLLAIAILVFKIKLAVWAPFLVVISGLRQVAFSRLEKNDTK